MKSFLMSAVTAVLMLAPLSASAQNNPVVVELFTSQGCSSCPPADDYLAKLVDNDDILPLAFHVDYWDRLGWTDTLGSPEFTARQYAYGKAFANRSVWTPQFVIGGTAYSRGSFRDLIPSTVKKIKSQGDAVRLSATRNGGKIVINAEPLSGDLPNMLVSLVGYTDEDVVKIKRGENAGRTISYHNTVRSWVDVAKWNGQKAVSYSAPDVGDMRAAIIIQAEGNGAIFAAARVN